MEEIEVIEPILLRITLIDSVNIELNINSPVVIESDIDPFLAQQIGELLTDTNYLLTYQISKL
jgi:hypothetical protein